MIRLAVLGLLIPLLLAPRAQGAGPYEPNDATINAAGPLALQQTYSGSIETLGDRDFYFFYVTSPAQVVLTVKNLGGGGVISYFGTAILDSSATPLDAVSYIDNGEERAITVDLVPQKYYIEVAANEGSGDGYVLTTGGSSGAFGPYASIAAQCATANAAVDAAEAGLERAKAKLQRASARARRARYGNHRFKTSARTAYRKAKARQAAKRKKLKAARESREPSCFIAQ